MEKIPFAQYIINDVASEGSFFAKSFIGESYVVPTRLRKEETRVPWDCVKEFESRDDWSYIAEWDLFGYRAVVSRGPDYTSFVVRGKLALALLLIQDRMKKEVKAKNKRFRACLKQKKLDAAWWP